VSDRDPKRWLRSEAPEDQALARLLDAGRAEQPSSEQLDALAKRLAPTYSAAAPEPKSSSGTGAPLLPLAVGTVLVLTLAAAWWLNREPSGPTPQPVDVKRVKAAPPANVASPMTEPSPALTPEPPEVTPAPEPAHALPHPRRAPEGADPMAELLLLEEAHRALASEPRRTLEATATHARRFPRGQYAQEREVLAIEALLALQRVSGARTRAERFLARYPDSSHARRVRALLAAQTSPDSGAGTRAP
jgi:hypothetical protein